MTTTIDQRPTTRQATRLDFALLADLAAPESVEAADAIITGDPHNHSGYDLGATVTLTGHGWAATLHCGIHITRMGRVHPGLNYHPDDPGRPLRGGCAVTVAYDDQTERELCAPDARRLLVLHQAAITHALRQRPGEDSQTLADLLGRRGGWAPRQWHHRALRALAHITAA